jgi:hypothetical protein
MSISGITHLGVAKRLLACARSCIGAACGWQPRSPRRFAHIGRTGLVMACVARGGGVSYRLVHQASMITSWAMPVSMV